jgi:hypothetical protein
MIPAPTARAVPELLYPEHAVERRFSAALTLPSPLWLQPHCDAVRLKPGSWTAAGREPKGLLYPDTATVERL